MKKQSQLYRAIDANLNRSREGLRVVEDYFRFVLDDKTLSSKIKRLRHQIIGAASYLPLTLAELKQHRESQNDVGKNSFSKSERSKANLEALILANLQRTQEALRVLEDFSKLLNQKASFQFKTLRFAAYTLEKELLEKR